MSKGVSTHRVPTALRRNTTTCMIQDEVLSQCSLKAPLSTELVSVPETDG